ncbi:MAG TPA: hypothetical protein VFF52_00035 [Isosphaeraceae bacterium]|nr:hypothetical protein [Isosphaeraceae bacterium]
MNRIRVSLASALLSSMIAGCGGGGIQEGMATGEPSQAFKDSLEQQGKFMQMQRLGEKKAAAALSKIGSPEPEKKAGP